MADGGRLEEVSGLGELPRLGGLTGLAQINDATGHEPDRKLRYDLEYIRKQSFWFDLKIVIRQIWQVFGDVVETIRA